MHDCFNMAYQDNANALQLHIKINSENLLPVSQKYNAGSLRIPADPSWPKIPQRKLTNDGDTIEPPCIVKLSGTPRSRTIVQTSLNQSPKSTVTKDSAYSSFHHQKTTSSMYTLRKFPGYIDPRFKNRVTNIKKNQVTSTESLQKEVDQSNVTTFTEHLHTEETEKLMPEREQTKIEKGQKLHEEKEIKSTQNYMANHILDINKELQLEKTHCTKNSELKRQDYISEGSNKNEITAKDKCVKNVNSFEHISKSIVNDANTQVDITSMPVQESNGQLFFVLDKKLQSHPLSAITVPQEYVNQCYNVQLPILAMQVSTTGTSNVIQQCINHSEYQNQIKTPSLRKEESEHHIHSNQTQNKSTFLINNIEEKDIYERKNTLVVQSNALEENRKSCFTPDFPENSAVSEKLPNLNIQKERQESSDSEYYIPDINKRNIHNNVLQCLKMRKMTCDASGEETTDSEIIRKRIIFKKEFIDTNESTKKGNNINTDAIHDDIKALAHNHDKVNYISKNTDQNQSLYQNYKIGICETKGRNKSEQYLSSKRNRCTRKLCRNSEPYITFKQKKTSAKFSRKARSYFQKNSHSALVDSDYTLVWPNFQYNKYKRNHTNIHKFSKYKARNMSQHFYSVPTHKRNTNTQISNVSNLIEQNYLQSNKHIDSRQEVTKSLSRACLQREHYKYEISPRSNTDDKFERSKGISPKTQELLNKSYWEYYNRLRHKIKNTSSIEQQYSYNLTMDTPEERNKGKVNEVYDQELRSQLEVNPELRTLKQCTALSTMINKALDSNLESNIVQTEQLYINDNMKTSLNHIVSAQNSNTKKISYLTTDESVTNKVRCNGYKTNDKKFLELKSIIFFGGMMYILIIFLPMLYDYFYYEEYDDYYENLSYLELVVEYIFSSFKEAFGGVFNGLKQIFFYPHACKKCTNIT
ncbi:uncharacterized protein LOC100649728 isoform X2 [Bombus terrestris]|uniref:Uncharacterized protein LOC100649728 isoform X2 n=1 Tax=Bombus terrestris TaxID=30195 RepID=A0A9C6W307_BOMTE|nr:uncharacterized protein LOC100649728 isoform X2 [Bombus terrestris]